MIALETWLEESRNPCIQKWCSVLITLGASWETFKREQRVVVQNLSDEGIPKLAACDLYTIVKEALIHAEAPLAVYWNLENIPIPMEQNAKEIVTRMKAILSQHGSLVHFRVYGHIPECTRSELQLSGCSLVDVSQGKNKDLIDKLIFLDAIEFAFQSETASICFITSDVDYTYLLSKLQKPQWKTIVISTGHADALHKNCDIAIQWEREILQPKLTPPPGFQPFSSSPFPLASQSIGKASCIVPNATTVRESPSVKGQASVRANVSEYPEAGHFSDEEVRILRTVVVNNAHVGISGPGTLKSQVGGMLRTTYPLLFSDRAAVQIFLAKAIATGNVLEGFHGGLKVLYLPEDRHKIESGMSIILSDRMPLALDQIPSKVKGVSKDLPMLIFFAKHQIPPYDTFPEKTFVQSAGKWIILMYRSLCDIDRAVKSKPWLSAGIKIDWRAVTGKTCPTSIPELFPCAKCESNSSVAELFAEAGSESRHCRSCFISDGFWTEAKATNAVWKVIKMLEMMSENDDVYVRSSLLRKLIVERWPEMCYSRGQAALWVEAAVESGSVCELNIKGQSSKRSKVVCLGKNLRWASQNHPDASMETDTEEQLVRDLLWEGDVCIPRTEIINKLEQVFPTMDTPLKRNKMFLNAAARNIFCIGKGPHGQVVGLTKEDVEAGLKMLHRVDFQPDGDLNSEERQSSVSSVPTIDLERLLASQPGVIDFSRNQHQLFIP